MHFWCLLNLFLQLHKVPLFSSPERKACSARTFEMMIPANWVWVLAEWVFGSAHENCRKMSENVQSNRAHANRNRIEILKPKNQRSAVRTRTETDPLNFPDRKVHLKADQRTMARNLQGKRLSDLQLGKTNNSTSCGQWKIRCRLF